MNDLNHIAFIMDGNGRWGLKKKKSRNYGHLKGVKTVQKIVEASILFSVPIISFYVFSTENWKRPKSEINYLFNLIKIYFIKEINNIIKNNIKIVISGRLQSLPLKIRKILKSVVSKTKKNNKLVVNLAINYGSRTEFIDAVKKNNYNSKKVTKENIEKNLYSDLVFPDILVRTGGQKRLSNFMLWQLAYSEIFFLDKLWPDFTKNDLKKVIKKYHKIKRNFGGI
jgi:undecaprenyl diphosphate synthase|tara:strand:+ start:658 stop:1332 length:675 start_codon:yes stop_codon:yes gene_type:complete